MDDLSETMKEAVAKFLATCKAEGIAVKIHLQYADSELILRSRMWEEKEEEDEEEDEEELV